MRLARVRLLARARELAGVEVIEVALPEPADVAVLRRALAEQFPVLAALVERSAIAIDEEYAKEDQEVRSGAEVALLPPVSGGAFEQRVAPMTAARAVPRLRAPGHDR
jgi:molybdopterin synthase catalytic subunit